MNTTTDKPVIVRIPPSPTGNLHIGTARTALFNYLFARHHGGKIIFRSEDTDQTRSKPEFEQNIIEGLTWLGISWNNEVPIRQSQRSAVYQVALKRLLAEGKAYISKEETVKEGGRAEVIRYKNPNVRITFTDLIRGEISFDTTELKDFVIAKSIDEPLYHLAVVVDDIEMGVTHVLRGEDHISNTPRQILLIEALGAQRPYYAHIPLILAPDRTKMSKRHGAVAVSQYKDAGFLPEAIINYLALLGWNPGTEQELFSIEELITSFDLSKIQKGGAIFDIEKLKWFNRAYIKKLPKEDRLMFIERELPTSIKELPGFSVGKLKTLVDMLTERISTFKDIARMAENGELHYFFVAPTFAIEKLLWKGEGDVGTAASHLFKAAELLATLSEHPTAAEVKTILWPYAEEKGRGAVLWPIRYTLSGLDKSPDPFELISLLGRNESITRLTNTAQRARTV